MAVNKSLIVVLLIATVIPDMTKLIFQVCAGTTDVDFDLTSVAGQIEQNPGSGGYTTDGREKIQL